MTAQLTNTQFDEFKEIALQPVSIKNVQVAGGSTIPGYKTVVNETLGKGVSVVSDKYQLLPNEAVISPILNFLDKENINYIYDEFTHVDEYRMRMHLSFPDIKISDDSEEGIVSSIFVHNSYDLTERARFSVGSMRQVCSNGMIFGEVLKELAIRHDTNNITETITAHAENAFTNMEKSVQVIQARINELIEAKMTYKQLGQLYARFGENRMIVKQAMVELGICEPETPASKLLELIKEHGEDKVIEGFNQYNAYNFVTDYISHHAGTRYQSMQLKKTGQIFEL